MEITVATLIKATEDGQDTEDMERPEGWTEDHEVGLCYLDWMSRLHRYVAEMREKGVTIPDLLPADLLKYDMDFKYGPLLRG